MKNSIKRAQSQAGLSFAERKIFRPKVKHKFSRYIMTLVALFAMTAGAWAQGADEVTMTKSTTVKNTWTFTMPDTNVELEAEYYNLTAPTANTADIYAGSSTALINAGETTETGATMKYMVTATDTQPTSTDGFSADVPTAQDKAITEVGTYYVWYYLDFDSGDDSDISATAIEVTVKAPRATIATAPAAKDDICQGETTEQLVTEGVVGGGENPEGTMMYAVTTDTTKPTSTEGFSADVPTVDNRPADTYYVWYYVKGDETHSDSDISATAIEVTVKAPRATATAPTANTADGDIYAGSTTSLISGGTATGGTMMYAVTATETQPTSTDGFSATVPTAQDQAINGAGTYYVWYYVKGDDSHSDSKISATAIEVTVKAPRATIATYPAAAVDPIYISTDVPLITGGETSHGTLMYFAQISTADAPTSTTGFSTDLPSAKEITEPGTYNVYYYIVGDDEHSNSEIFSPILVAVLTDKYDITFNAANNYTIDGDNSKGTVKVNGTDKTLDAEHKLKAVKMGSTVTINAATGYKFRSVKAAEEKPIAINLTTDAAEEGASFTEISFTMPASDATMDYEVVRDLSYKTTANVIIGTGQEAETVTGNTRLRIKKDGDKGYVFVNALAISFSDNLEGVVITKDGFETAKLVPQFFIQQDDEQHPWVLVPDENLDPETGLPNNLQPGQVYCVTFVPGEGSAYDGETPQSVTITLFEGYPVEVAAKEFVTYYREDDNLTVDENSGAQLYTITSVGETTATATEIPSANKEMPFLIYNNSDKTQTFVLIPTDDQINQTHAIEFVGTAGGTTISASNGDWTNYAFNGKSFVWVKNPVSIAANKAWLSIPTAKSVRAITLVFEEENETGINNVNDNVNVNYNDSWYDLNGRKLPEAPKRRGVFIVNGKKVVIK